MRYSDAVRIRSKLAVTYTIVSFLGLTAISIFFYFYVKDTLTSKVLRQLESVSSLQKHRIEAVIEQNLERIGLVASRTQLRISLERYLNTGQANDSEKIQLILHDALNSISSFSVISILDKTGHVVESTEPSRVGRDYSDYNFFPMALKRNNARFFFHDEKDALKLYLSGPLWIGEKLVGVLLIESSADNIVSLMGDYSGLGTTGETQLGELSNDGKSALFLAPLRFDMHAALQRLIPIDNLTSPLVQALKKQRVITPAIDYRGKPVLAAANYIDSTGWGLVVKMDEAEALAPVHMLLKYFLMIGLGVMIVVIGVSYFLAGIISRPIVNLTRVAHDINEGDLSHRAVIKSKDEVGELAETFNNMTNNLILTQYDLEKSNRELHSHRDHLNEMVEKRTQELQSTIEELESFSYSVSHDLRSPLRAIDGYSYLLLEKYGLVLDEEGKANFQRIRLATQRMGNLIDDLLKLSHINRKEIVREKIDLSEKVAKALKQLNNDDTRPVEFIVQPDLIMECDESLMGIALDNLIDNAWKYTSRNDSVRIEFGSEEKDGRTVYFVRDNGIGFDMQYANNIFGAFHRLVREEDYPGTGIGLATVARVIQRHGGRIWAEGQPGHGATFYFRV